ncbi:PaaI family thioesterase [Ovoidimarina sediminis]|uniref:PaaI family thioesterase n=1 Tax=Ovoidimarina sediminis TaxID=3079856 RepID=UPI00290D182E|nr:PaaI family thioesterase [Rhodophyticola sp. MJ-SS7]MDU8944924.1 PaaI family thioesterase [Rhodophyticola sp. MJ-SS7]
MTDLRSLAGLDALRRVIDGKHPGPTIARTLNFRLVAVEHGKATFRGTPGGDVLNPVGLVHGGWYGAILDSALGCAVHSSLAAGEAYVTLEYKVNLTRAIPPGMQVEAIGQLDHRGRSTGVATAELRGLEDGKLYATGSTTCMIFPAPPPKG